MSGTRYLADTHILLWALGDDMRLPAHHRKILLSDASVFFSAASIWEIAIKQSLGKLQAPENLTLLLPRAGFRALDITSRHAEAVSKLPFIHNDPFDRLLIAQSRLEKMTILTVDKHIARYKINTV